MNEHLKNIYGYNSFRVSQKNIIDDVLNGENTMVIFPTGQGKSLCYQFPATFLNKTTIVISPLLSLMEDQKQHLEKKGIKTICLNGNNSHIPDIGSDIITNVIYTTPEFLTSHLNKFQKIIKNICLIAIDEAHCMSAWGHDFRTSYTKLNILQREFSTIPIMLLTATATPIVIDDMYQTIGLESINEYNNGTTRTNLFISVCKKTTIANDLGKLIKKNESTIIYTQTRKNAEEVSKCLQTIGIESEFYHAGLSSDERNKLHTKFITNTIRVLVATICFGMGIDKSDIRTIINWGAPCDIETYYQEIGRAGRDGIDSKVYLFYSDGDFKTNRFLISKSTKEQYKVGMLNIFKMYIENTEICRQVLINQYFQLGKIDLNKITNDKTGWCLKCDNCMQSTKEDKQSINAYKEVKIIMMFIQSLFCNYGITKLIDTLKGKKSPKLGKLQLNTYYGVFKMLDEIYIKQLFKELIDKEYLQTKIYKYSDLIQLGPSILDENIEFIVKIKQNVKNTVTNKFYDIRQSIANQTNIPSYMIISDTVIERINEIQPKSMEELYMIDGISDTFLAMYGHYFISKYTRTANCDKKSPTKETSSMISFTMYKEGMEIDQICIDRNLKRMTIEDHIVEQFTLQPNLIDYHRFGITDEIKQEIKKAVSIVGVDKLKPIKEVVNSAISYLQIKVCLICV